MPEKVGTGKVHMHAVWMLMIQQSHWPLKDCAWSPHELYSARTGLHISVLREPWSQAEKSNYFLQEKENHS